MNFDDISKKLREFGQNTVDEVQKMNEVRRLNSGISSEKKRINSVYTEIGRKMYNLYKSEPLSGFEAEIGSLKAAFRKIDSLQEQIRTVKGVRLCPHCKSEVNVSERFCPNCGSRMPEEYTVEADEISEHQKSGDPEHLEGEVLRPQENEAQAPETGSYEDAAGPEAESEPAEAENAGQKNGGTEEAEPVSGDEPEEG